MLLETQLLAGMRQEWNKCALNINRLPVANAICANDN